MSTTRTVVAIAFASLSLALFVYGASTSGGSDARTQNLALLLLLLVPTTFIVRRLVGAPATLQYGQVENESPSGLRLFSMAAAALGWCYAAALSVGIIGFPGG